MKGSAKLPKKNPSEKHEKKNTSLRLDKKVLKRLKIIAIQEDTSVQALIEGLINSYLDNRTDISIDEST